MTAVRGHASYGVDAPPVLLVLGALTGGYLIATVIVGLALSGGVVVWVLAAITLVMAAQFGLYLHATRRGKFQVWARLLDDLALRGEERVLDLGCGRGAVLLAVARRLPTGRAVGVDLWRSADQSGNSQETTAANAAAEGLDDRVELHTGDMTDLPFADGAFDVVVSSLAIHNIKKSEGRAAAVREALRVLRPGGRLLLADISKTTEYQTTMTDAGAIDVTIRPLGWRMWWGSPFMSTKAVAATAPSRGFVTSGPS
ncbi:class I SAM-dependent methyltransferase [Nocardia sp. NPDC004278]